jgi:hypothetical protein
MLLVFVEEISERLLYTFDFVLKERGIEFSITNDPVHFEQVQTARFNYSEREIEGVLRLKPAPILFDESLQVYGIDKGIFEYEECLSINGNVDPLAAIFYVLSRMEEYNSQILDKHGRFPATNSVLYRFNWLDKVVCDRWAEAFISYLLENKLLHYSRKPSDVEIQPTFDIDNAYAFKLKRGLRHWFAIVKDILKGRTHRIIEREQVIYGGHKDPYDTYEQIESLSKEGYNIRMFWLLGDYTKFDRNISFRNQRHRKLINRMSKSADVYIHPSYKSNSYEFYLNAEKERLEEILNVPIEHARQHYLKVHFPYTYQHLEIAEIRHEYSMGFPEHYGFRAGTARPFRWFDLERNKISSLTVHPFAYMDGTLHEYMKISPSEAKQVIQKLYNEVREFGGEFLFIWHNETIGDYGKWKGWKEVFEFTLQLKKPST